MSSEREERALDALIVSQLRATQDDETDVEHLPELTDEEREALDSLGSDFVERLLAGEIDEPTDDPPEEAELAMAGEEAFGLNRAEEIDEDTKEELDQKRKEVIDRITQEDEDSGESGE